MNNETFNVEGSEACGSDLAGNRSQSSCFPHLWFINNDPNLCLGYRCKSRSAFCNIHEVLEIRRNVQGLWFGERFSYSEVSEKHQKSFIFQLREIRIEAQDWTERWLRMKTTYEFFQAVITKDVVRICSRFSCKSFFPTGSDSAMAHS